MHRCIVDVYANHYVDIRFYLIFLYFFFNDTATTEIYTLSLHDALPIFNRYLQRTRYWAGNATNVESRRRPARDRKSTRLNSSHSSISYAVFCLKKKKNTFTESIL